MKTLLAFLLSTTCASAQMMTGIDKTPGGGAAYSGPANVIASPLVFWGLRAVSATYASGSGKLANVCLPAAGACFDVTSNASGNAVIPGGLSTCNNSTVLCTIKIFYDQSGALNCSAAACDLTQATQASQAVFVVPGAANGCTSSTHVCALFANDYYQSPAGFPATAQPFTFSFVVNNPTYAGSAEVLFYPNFAQPIIDWNGTSTMACYAGNTTSAPITDGSYHALQCAFNNPTSWDFNVDGTPNTTFNQGALGFTNPTTFGVGQVFGAGGAPFSGFVSEMGVWGVNFSAGNSSSMSTNQHGYWNF